MFLRHNALGIAWAALILVILGLPGDQFENTKREHLDKVIHLILFAVLYVLWVVGLIKQHLYPALRRNPHTWVIIGSTVYGVAIEACQHLVFVQRSIEFGDVLSNMAGCVVGVTFFFAVYGRHSYL